MDWHSAHQFVSCKLLKGDARQRLLFLSSLPPWEDSLIASFELPVMVAAEHLERPKTGHASPLYGMARYP